MANYYYVTIKSDKMTQDIAAKIFDKAAKNHRIRYFDYDENHLKFNTRGLPDIGDILESYGFKDEEVEVKMNLNWLMIV